MCVLASAVDIFILTHREAVISEQLVTVSLRFYTLGQYDGFTRDTLRACHARRWSRGSPYTIYSSCEMEDLEGH